MSKNNAKRKRSWPARDTYARQHEHYRYLLRGMAVSAYKWENLPDEIDERYLETTLYFNALSLFYFDSEFDRFFAQEATPSGQINMCRNPLHYRAIGANGYHKDLDWSQDPYATECVPIWANYQRYPALNTMEIYATRLASIDRTIDINLAAQRQPILITCPEEQQLSMRNLLNDYDGGEPAVLGYTNMMDLSSFSVLDPGARYNIDKLLTDKARIWAEICTFLGIDNANQDKKERLVADEVSANDGQIEMCRLANLNARRLACDQINKRWGLDISVHFNADLSTSNYDYSNSLVLQATGGVEDGGI